MLGGLRLTQNQFYFKFNHENLTIGAKLSDGTKLGPKLRLSNKGAFLILKCPYSTISEFILVL